MTVKMKIKRGDVVFIISGKDRGKKGKVLKVLPEASSLIVEGVNLRKKHVRARKAGEKGQIITKGLPLHASNVKVICTRCDKAVRIGYKMEGQRKYRFCKKCKAEI